MITEEAPDFQKQAVKEAAATESEPNSNWENMVEKVRKQLHDMVDQEMDNLLNRFQIGGSQVKADFSLPLNSEPSFFKGKKPISILYPDGTEVPVKTWRKAAFHLLSNCASQPEMLDRLYAIRNRVSGRDRTILSDTTEGMDCPVEIAPELFLEGKFDTETLLRVITQRIFKPIGYNYHGIYLRISDPVLQAIQENRNQELTEDEGQENDAAFSMECPF